MTTDKTVESRPTDKPSPAYVATPPMITRKSATTDKKKTTIKSHPTDKEDEDDMTDKKESTVSSVVTDKITTKSDPMGVTRSIDVGTSGSTEHTTTVSGIEDNIETEIEHGSVRRTETEAERNIVPGNDTVSEELEDPCEGKECSFGARCVASLDGMTARCQCPEKCDNFGDSVGSDPVCGTDGRDYANTCELKKRACEDMKDVEKKFDGKCDPCHGFHCPFGQLCQLDNTRRPICRCGDICPMIFDPVCGSDGKTYANECLLQNDACRRQTDVRLLFHGECSSGTNPCSGKVCGALEHCYVDSSFTAHCSCPPECPPLLRPVCGSDGQTYDSECHLRRRACLNKVVITVSYHGSCDKPGPCSKHNCSNGRHCVVHNGHANCVCPTCSEEYEPVCGSDNASYQNECKLQHENCETAKSITVRYRGRCLADTCAQKKCDFYSVCEINDKGMSHCICPDLCEQVTATVCGSDGVTYSNECELQRSSCKQQKVISIVLNGSCDPCEGVVCDYGGTCHLGECVCLDDCPSIDEPVCASNGVTYPNECTMMKTGCEQKMVLNIVHDGSCDEMSGSGDHEVTCDESNCQFGGVCELDLNGFIRCSCDFNCDAIRSPVCGSDGKTYGNECQLKEESCRKQVPIFMETCEDIDEQLCDGESPLRNSLTGREYNCNRGKDICPANSYCHKLGPIARCCGEEQSTQSCANSKFGCCLDGITAAPGPNNAGCPNVCQCNTLGSLSTTCDPLTRQCVCKPGVGGVKCDRCNPNFWGLTKIAEGNNSCLPCGCNIHGSMRDDCEQMTGRCMCRPGITGQRCNICPNGKYLGPTGCSDVMLNDEIVVSTTSGPSCSENYCHSGAICRMSNGLPECICPLSCPEETDDGKKRRKAVCGSDGQTYSSICRVKLVACRTQKKITVAKHEPCHATSSKPATSTDDFSRPKAAPKSAARIKSRNQDFDYPTDVTFVFGILEEQCLSDADCSVDNSRCDNGFCSCKDLWKPSEDKQSCIAVRNIIPSFSGNSMLQLKQFTRGNGELTIEINFRPQSTDGILLYAAQSIEDGGKDFISLALRNGFIEFRYNLGSGLAVVTSVDRVQMGTFHTVSARRSGKSGYLSLDNGIESFGMSPGNLRSLNLDTPVYLGNADADSEQLMKNVGMVTGFVGCVKTLAIKNSGFNVTYDITNDKSTDIEKRVNMGNFCQDNSGQKSACEGTPCGSGGVCESLPRGGFRCNCFSGFGGSRCENVQRVPAKMLNEDSSRAVSFDGSTFFQYQNGISAVEKSQATNKFVVKFHSRSIKGLLILMHKSGTIEGDYLGIAINGGHVQVSFNLGKQRPNDILFMTSSLNVTDGDWHTLVFTRIKRRAQLYVDDESPISTTVDAPGATHLDTDGRLWIGGNRNQVHGLPESYMAGFHGCIQYVKVNDKLLDLIEDREVRVGSISFCST